MTTNKLLTSLMSLAIILFLSSASGCNEDATATNNVASAEITTQEIAKEEPLENASPVEKQGQKVKITTQQGDITVLLYDDTPLHRDNFIKLVKEGFYNDLLFHRVMNNFMIQGGDPNSKGAAADVRLGSGGPGYKIDAEFLDHRVHVKGALAAARQPDQVNPARQSSGSQFYIVHGKSTPKQQLLGMEASRNRGKAPEDQFHYTPEQIEAYETMGGTPFLDGQYTVFGEVVEGLNVVDAIAGVKTKPGDRPVEDVVMSMTLID